MDNEQAKGYWIWGDVCSNCGISKYNFFETVRGRDGKNSGPFGIWHYCPGCGAKMSEKEEE